MRRTKFFIVVSTLLIFSNVSAQPVDGSGLLQDVSNAFATEAAGWLDTIHRYARWMFLTLASISVVWTFGMMAIRRADIGDFFAELIRFSIFIGFFWWLLQNGPAFATSIVNSFRIIGSEAGNIGTLITPSTPIDIAFDIIKKASIGYLFSGPIDRLTITFTLMAILACMGIVAANLLLTIVTTWIVAFAGVFVLGFGGSRWTSDIAVNYFRAVLGISLKLMTMTLMVGISNSIMRGLLERISEGATYRELLSVFVVALVLAILIHSIPNTIANLIPGGGAATGIGSFSGSDVHRAAQTTSGALKAAGTVATAGAAGIAGATMAIKAATQSASHSISNSSSGGSSSISRAGKIAAKAGTNLVETGFSMARNAANDRIEQTIGGKMAKAIQEKHRTQASSNGKIDSEPINTLSGSKPEPMEAKKA